MCASVEFDSDLELDFTSTVNGDVVASSCGLCLDEPVALKHVAGRGANHVPRCLTNFTSNELLDAAVGEAWH